MSDLVRIDRTALAAAISAVQADRGLQHHAAVHTLRLVGRHPHVRITSELRVPAHNRRVGGVPDSLHIKGKAIDVAAPTRKLLVSYRDWLQMDRCSLECTGPVELIVEADHVHVAW